MATVFYNLRGEAYWTKLDKDNPDEYAGDRRWMMSLVLDDINVFNKTGLQLKIKDIDGRNAINLRRGVKKLFGDDITFFTPPLLINSSNKWTRFFVANPDKGDEEKYEYVFSWKKDEPEPTMIGEDLFIPNGSEVIARVAVYDTQKGKGHRLESVKVLHLAEMPEMSENRKIEKDAEPTTSGGAVETKEDDTTESTGIKSPW